MKFYPARGSIKIRKILCYYPINFVSIFAFDIFATKFYYYDIEILQIYIVILIRYISNYESHK